MKKFLAIVTLLIAATVQAQEPLLPPKMVVKSGRLVTLEAKSKAPVTWIKPFEDCDFIDIGNNKALCLFPSEDANGVELGDIVYRVIATVPNGTTVTWSDCLVTAKGKPAPVPPQPGPNPPNPSPVPGPVSKVGIVLIKDSKADTGDQLMLLAKAKQWAESRGHVCWVRDVTASDAGSYINSANQVGLPALVFIKPDGTKLGTPSKLPNNFDDIVKLVAEHGGVADSGLQRDENGSFLLQGGVKRYLTAKRTTDAGMRKFAKYGDTWQRIPQEQWKDFTLANVCAPRILDQDGRGACFPAGTMIRLWDGSEKPIESIRVGDIVLTAEGRKGDVTETMVRREEHFLIVLTVFGHGQLKLTKEHPVLTQRGYVEAEQLTTSDVVAITGKEKTEWKSIVAIGQIPFSGYVYNFEVEGDHSYVAEGVGVHNCVGHGSCGAFEMAWRLNNRQHLDFSPWFIYGQINGGRDQGAVVGDALLSLQQDGTCLFSSVPYAEYRSSRFPKEAYTEAKRFKPDLVYHCPSWEDMISACLRGHPVVFGIDIGGNFNPNSQGLIPEQRGGGGGHCMFACGVQKINGKWYAHIVNSWGTGWGVNGTCFMPSSYFDNGSMQDAFAIVTVKNDPQDPMPLPMLKSAKLFAPREIQFASIP